MTRFSIALSALLVIFAVAGCGGGQSGDTVAEVGDTKISAGELLVMYDQISAPSRPPFTTLEEKKAFLQTVISKEILVQEAKTRGLDEAPDIVSQIDTQRETMLFRRLFQEKAQKQVTFTPEELEEFYKETQAEIRLRDIWIEGFTPDKLEKLNTAVAKLRAGESFEAVARRYSENDYATDGGDLGWKSISTPELGLFRPDLDELEVGDISDPIEVPNGHHIIMLADHRPAPMEEFEQRSIQTRNGLRRQKQGELWKEYVEGLTARHNVIPVAPNIQLVIERAKATEQGSPMEFSDEEKAKPLVTYDGGEWTIGDLTFFLGSVAQNFRPQFDNPDFDSSQWIVGRATNRVLVKEAEQLGLDQTGDFSDRLERKREELMLERLHHEIVAGVSVSPEEIRQFYEDKQDSLMNPSRAEVRLVFTRTQARIDSAFAALQSGADFETVVQNFSEDAATRERGGRVDSLFQGRFGSLEADQAIFGLNPGETSRPLSINNAFYLFQMIKKYRGAPMTFEEAEPRIREFIKNEKEIKEFESWLEGRRQAMNVRVFDDALNAIAAEERGA